MINHVQTLECRNKKCGRKSHEKISAMPMLFFQQRLLNFNPQWKFFQHVLFKLPTNCSLIQTYIAMTLHNA
jgi:hypothetical protein